jgi:hypothetical protein
MPFGTLVAITVPRLSKLESERIGGAMKAVWMWVIFLVVYGMFSMKTQAAELQPFDAIVLEDGCARYSL